jgi:hypothetical protein
VDSFSVDKYNLGNLFLLLSNPANIKRVNSKCCLHGDAQNNHLNSDDEMADCCKKLGYNLIKEQTNGIILE